MKSNVLYSDVVSEFELLFNLFPFVDRTTFYNRILLETTMDDRRALVTNIQLIRMLVDKLVYRSSAEHLSSTNSYGGSQFIGALHGYQHE